MPPDLKMTLQEQELLILGYNTASAKRRVGYPLNRFDREVLRCLTRICPEWAADRDMRAAKWLKLNPGETRSNLARIMGILRDNHRRVHGRPHPDEGGIHS